MSGVLSEHLKTPHLRNAEIDISYSGLQHSGKFLVPRISAAIRTPLVGRSGPSNIFTSINMERVLEVKPRVEVWPATDSGVLRLSAHGLWDGVGKYTSVVVDIGSIVTLSGVFWDSGEEFLTSVDSTEGLPKTLELRYHDYNEPLLNDKGDPWSDG